MMPENTRVLRRERRKAWKGTPRGRRSTHKTETAARKQRSDSGWPAWLVSGNTMRAAETAEPE